MEAERRDLRFEQFIPSEILSLASFARFFGSFHVSVYITLGINQALFLVLYVLVFRF